MKAVILSYHEKSACPGRTARRLHNRSTHARVTAKISLNVRLKEECSIPSDSCRGKDHGTQTYVGPA